MAQSFLLGIIQGVAEDLTLDSVRNLNLWGVENEVEELKRTVSTIEAVLLDAEEKQAAGSHQVRDWLEKLQYAFYDAEDLLDAISTDALRRQINQVSSLFANPMQILDGSKIRKEIKKIRERLNSIKDDRQFHLEVRNVETRVQNRERDNTHSFVREEQVIGRENDKNAVIQLLMMDSNVEPNVSILPIVGIGGLGKTTLAQLIFNDEKVKNYFELKMWVCVSDNFDVKVVVEKIVESATKKKPETIEMDTLVGKLNENMDGKKYLLVLDDVWNENPGKWSQLKVLLVGGARGSRILVTTRSKKVAKITHTIEPYFLSGLDEPASWCLFKEMAFDRGQEPENSTMVAIGREIVKRCVGVPLAVRTMGGLLYLKNSESEWLSFMNNEFLKISQEENDILPTLKLSYDHLPSHLKHCFVYCSLFPKDYWIDKSALIKLWMAQGFVKLSNQGGCLEDVGHDYFMDLLWRSFFQEAERDEYGNIIRCKMHDLMHDLALSMAKSLITTLDDKNISVDEKTRHVWVGYKVDTSSISTSLSKASRIRTLMLNCPVDIDCDAMFSSLKFLRVLDLKYHWLTSLPMTIGKLEHLRVLNLSCHKFKKLPDSITMLVNLQTLTLSNCDNLEELPGDIKNLVNLRHLEIGGCYALAYMPCGLGQLNKLQTLSRFVVHSGSVSGNKGGLKELNGLNNLVGKLVIAKMKHGKDVALEFKAANLKEKRLHALSLNWALSPINQGDVNDSDVMDDDRSLEGFQPHKNLKELELLFYRGSRLPNWLLSLKNLVRFYLRGCKKCKYLPPLSQLPSLKYLSLFLLEAMQYISDSGDSNEFYSSTSAPVPFCPSLEKIQIYNCPNLKGWWKRRDSSVEVNNDISVETTGVTSMMENQILPSFPLLSKLSIFYSPLLTSMPMFPHLEYLHLQKASFKPLQQTLMMNMGAPQSPTSTAIASSSSTPLSKLKSLCLEFIVDLETLPDEDEMHWQGLKSLISLQLAGLPKLESLPLGLQYATTLKKLQIFHCESLTAIPEWIHNYKSLQVFEIRECSSLTSLPQGMRSLMSLQRLTIDRCPILLQKCKRETGEDWSKIAHIPELDLPYLLDRSSTDSVEVQNEQLKRRENPNIHSSSTDSESAEPVRKRIRRHS